MSMLKNSSPGSWASPSMRRWPRLLWVIRRPGRLPTLARWSSRRLLWELAMRSKNSSVCGDVIRVDCAVGRSTQQGHCRAQIPLPNSSPTHTKPAGSSGESGAVTKQSLTHPPCTAASLPVLGQLLEATKGATKGATSAQETQWPRLKHCLCAIPAASTLVSSWTKRHRQSRAQSS